MSFFDPLIYPLLQKLNSEGELRLSESEAYHIIIVMRQADETLRAYKLLLNELEKGAKENGHT